LKEAGWSSVLKISSVLLSIQSLLNEPNPDDPLDNNVAHMWVTDLATAQDTARQYTQMYAN